MLADIRLIGAVAHNWVAGKAGHGMLWHAPADLRRFREVTMGHTVVMGRATYRAIGHPLPHRRNIVLTGRRAAIDGRATQARSLEEAIEIHDSPGPVFVIGGRRPWEEALSLASTIYLTRLDLVVAGDILFPEIETASSWRLATEDVQTVDVDGAPTRCEFLKYLRRSEPASP